MSFVQWLALNTQTAVLAVMCALLVLILLYQEHARRCFERRMLREQRTLQSRIQDDGQTRQESFASLSAMLESSARSNEQRVQEAGRLMAETAEKTQKLNHDIRENALEQQLALQKTLDEKIKELQHSNEAKLDAIRASVDEKLQTTLQRRLGESFQQVSDQLERVYKGLGEMQNLAGSVGDLKRVLQNVTVRGAWGEARLEAIITQNLTESQFLRNTPVESGATERVEFAIVFPGNGGETVLLPVDSKFPQEDYDRLTQAAQDADKQAIEKARKELARALTAEAKRISTKYIRPPHTTDFAVMFLPTEGLFAEVMHIPGLAEEIQRTFRVIPAGPTTFTALLTSLQMGFRTLAVEQRSAEVWKLLGQVRRDFQSFGESIEKTRKRLEQASSELDGAASRSRTINRRLAGVENPDEIDDGGQTKA